MNRAVVILSKMPLNTRKIGQHDVNAIGYGTMGLSAFYGKAKPDEERFEVYQILWLAKRLSLH